MCIDLRLPPSNPWSMHLPRVLFSAENTCPLDLGSMYPLVCQCSSTLGSLQAACGLCACRRRHFSEKTTRPCCFGACIFWILYFFIDFRASGLVFWADHIGNENSIKQRGLGRCLPKSGLLEGFWCQFIPTGQDESPVWAWAWHHVIHT